MPRIKYYKYLILGIFIAISFKVLYPSLRVGKEHRKKGEKES